MGACCSTPAASSDPDAPPRPRRMSAKEQAESDRARAMAAAAAEARQKKFDQSAVGKATKKAVAEAKKPAADARGDAVARDWLS